MRELGKTYSLPKKMKNISEEIKKLAEQGEQCPISPSSEKCHYCIFWKHKEKICRKYIVIENSVNYRYFFVCLGCYYSI